MARFDQSVFKANDIRGTYPDQLNEGFAFLFGRALGEVLGAERVAVGRDARLSSPTLAGALAEGLNAAGAEVGALGLCPIELVYHVTGSDYGFDLGVMVTASHNPAKFNGFKVVGPGAQPVTPRNGLDRVMRWIADAPAHAPGHWEPPPKSVLAEADYARRAAAIAGVPDAGGLKVVVDPGNGVGGLIWEMLSSVCNVPFVRMNFDPDGRFPAHEPNPSRLENLLPLRDRVLAEGADIGFAYDGDADRTMAVLDDGHITDGGETIAVLAGRLFGDELPAGLAVSMTASRKVLDHFRRRSGEPLIVPVGHAKVKHAMRSDPAIRFAGEQSGHYFYREFHCCESSLITTLHLLHLAAAGRLGPQVRSLPGPWVRPAREPTFHFPHQAEALAACRSVTREAIEVFPQPGEIMCEVNWQVARHCTPADVDQAQGVRVDYPDWWFCVRPSGTEPVVRLAVEDRSEVRLRQRLAVLTSLISGHLPD